LTLSLFNICVSAVQVTFLGNRLEDRAWRASNDWKRRLIYFVIVKD